MPQFVAVFYWWQNRHTSTDYPLEPMLTLRSPNLAPNLSEELESI